MPGEPWSRWEAGRVVGDSSVDSPGAIGVVAASTVSSRSELLVLDGGERSVLAFDTAGRLIARASGPGDGPGQLRDPVAIALLPGDAVVALDRSARRMHQFGPPSRGLPLRNTRSLDFSPRAACSLDSLLFVLGTRGASYLHIFGAGGSIRHSYSPVPPPTESELHDPVVRALTAELGGGVLACATREALLVHAPEYQGRVFGIGTDGRVRWTQQIESFVPPVRTPRSTGLRMDIDESQGHSHRVLSATYLGDGTIQLLVIATYLRASNRSPDTTSMVIRVADGAMIARSRFQHAFGAVSAVLALEHLEEPFPSVRVWRKPIPY